MLNRIAVMGRLVRDPDLRRTQSGTSVASFTLAVDRDAEKDKCDFINIVAWSGTAEMVKKYLGKGRLVAVDGRLQMRQWVDNDGKNRVTAEVVADRIHFCDKRPEQAAEALPLQSDGGEPW